MIKKIPIIIIIIVLIITAVFFVFCNDAYVLKIDNKKISVEEFTAYFYEQKNAFEETGGNDIWETEFDGVSAEEKAKQNAVNSLVLVKASIAQADKFGIALDEADKAQAIKTAQILADEINSEGFFCGEKEIKISEKQALRIVKESLLQQKIYNSVTDSFEITDNDFEEYYGRYIEENKSTLADFKVNYVFVEKGDNIERAYEKAEKIYSELMQGGKIEDIKEDNVSVMEEVSLSELNLPEDAERSIYSLSKGELSMPVVTDDGFYIVYVEDIITAEEKSEKERIKQEYIAERKNEIYMNQSKIWSENITVEKNEKIWNELYKGLHS